MLHSLSMDEEYPDQDLMVSPRDPMTQEQYDRILELVSQGWTVPSIAEETGVSKRKIKAVKARNPGLESAYKQHMVNSLTDFASRGIERMGKELPLMHIDKLPLAVAIVIDKAQLLQGQATQRIDTGKGISQEQLIAVLEKMKRANAKEIETEAVTESSPGLSESPSSELRYVNPHPNGYGLTPLR